MALIKRRESINGDNFVTFAQSDNAPHRGAVLVDGDGDQIGITGAPIKTSNDTQGAQKIIISRCLDDNGDGTGNKNATGDYSGAEEIFFCQPAAGTVFRISRIIVSIEDSQNFRAERYASLGGALSNGIILRSANDSGTLVDFTDGIPITTNARWGGLCFDVELKTWGAGDELLLAEFTFLKSGQFLRLDGDNNERLEVVLNDDFSGLINHKFLMQGYIE